MEDHEWRVQGFKGSAVASGLKKNGGLDLGLIFSETETVAAGVFTTGRVKAAPVLLSQKHLQNQSARAIIVNSGNANACTGERGLADAGKTAEMVARGLDISSEEILVASTGVIGAPLNMDAISRSVPGLVKSLEGEGIPKQEMRSR